MIIKQLACERFAGVRDADVRFEPGMNILLGANESGKSTLADLLYHLFFQEVKLDGRKDKAFLDVCFPKGTVADGDIIDGTVVFQTDAGRFKLYKEWAAGGNVCRLTLPDGTRISKPKEIRRLLDEQLRYGRGIFDEVIFASQKRQHSLLAGLLEPQKDKKNDASAMQELSATLSKAVLETGGIAIDQVEKRLTEKMNACAGRWDLAADMPEGGKARGIHNPWKVGCGTILTAYYEMETAAQMQRETENIEKAIEAINAKLREAKQQKQEAADRRERFAVYQSVISSRANLKALQRNEEDRLGAMKTAAQRWPVLADQKTRAEGLKRKLEQAALYECFTAVAELLEQCQAKEERLAQIGDIGPQDVRDAQDITLRINRLESGIHGLNLAARLKLLGDTPVSVVSAATNQPLDTGNGAFSITEAVEITVPGVMQLRLAPRGVDLDQIRAELAQARARLAEIFRAWGVDSADELRQNFDEARTLGSDIEALNRRIQSLLNGRDWEDVQVAAAQMGAPGDTAANIQREIRTLCGGVSVDIFLGQRAGLLQNYQDQYTSPEALAEEIHNTEQKLVEYARKLSAIADIPAEYQGITDGDAYAARLKAEAAKWEEAVDALHDQLRDTQLPPDSKSAEEYAEDWRIKKEKFEEEKAQYRHWAHIHQVFSRLREQEMGNPTQDIQAHFAEYLSILSDGAIRVSAMDEKLRSAMVSGSSRLTCSILSEGTKDTISLAFRLAMLEHLYPDGGAVAVFDDPFTDMDPRRTAQACRLLQRFAERNQVLFITCDEKYTNMLSGSIIPVAAAR